MLDTARFFNDSDFSDVTIKFSGREVKCHKIILCESECFKILCGPGSRFKESDEQTIELKEDDPRALEAVLRHIYGDDSMAPGPSEDWEYQLEMAKTACKYLFPKLEEMAMWRLKQLLDRASDTRTIAEVITKIRTNGDQQKHFDLANALEAEHLHALLKLDTHREHLEVYPEAILSHLDRLSFCGDLLTVDIAVCKNCGRPALCKIGATVTRACMFRDPDIHRLFGDYTRCMLPRYTAVEAGIDCDP